MASPAEWYQSLPPITKVWGTVLFGTTVASQLRILSPRALYLDWGLVARKFQIWRLLTNFLFLGGFSFRFLINLMMLLRYGVFLESVSFSGRSGDFLYCVLVGMGVMLATSLVLQSFLGLFFLSSSLVFMLLYLWSRENPNAQVSLMGFITVPGFYLPWAYLLLDLVMGASPAEAGVGILAGHVYYFLTVVYPGQGGPALLTTPAWVHQLAFKIQSLSSGGAAYQRMPPQPPPQGVARSGTVPPAGSSPAFAGAGGGSGGPTFRGRSYRLDRD